jgi:hypothetical protein
MGNCQKRRNCQNLKAKILPLINADNTDQKMKRQDFSKIENWQRLALMHNKRSRAEC